MENDLGCTLVMWTLPPPPPLEVGMSKVMTDSNLVVQTRSLCRERVTGNKTEVDVIGNDNEMELSEYLALDLV